MGEKTYLIVGYHEYEGCYGAEDILIFRGETDDDARNAGVSWLDQRNVDLVEVTEYPSNRVVGTF